VGTNQKIAEIFNAMGDILEIEEVPWKPRAYHAAARSLAGLAVDIRSIYKKGGLKGLEEISGIGESLGRKIVEYLDHGKIYEYERLKKTLPQGMEELLTVPGLGPYRVENLYHHGIHSPADLKTAVRDHKVAGLPGFGAKSEEKIAESLGLSKPHGNRKPRTEILPTANRMLQALQRLKEVDRVEIVGSLRRKEDTVGDIDLLAVTRNPGAVMDAFLAQPSVRKVVLRGPKKSEVILENGLQTDFRVFKPGSFGAAMIYFTGNKQHNIELRKIAIRKGLKLNEYGLFDKAGRRLAGKTEEEVYRRLGFKLIPPEKRKNQEELKYYKL